MARTKKSGFGEDGCHRGRLMKRKGGIKEENGVEFVLAEECRNGFGLH